jgi:hypothetical protein
VSFGPPPGGMILAQEEPPKEIINEMIPKQMRYKRENLMGFQKSQTGLNDDNANIISLLLEFY